MCVCMYICNAHKQIFHFEIKHQKHIKCKLKVSLKLFVIFYQNFNTLFARLDSLLVTVENDLPGVGVVHPEGVVVDVRFVVVLPGQDAGEDLTPMLM